ncbi:hypothetical protein [Flavobacterium sp.]|uniref:hypothetical protein n=1 Tax=Flavobacterium sp. TaxID=239 RepID=UPI003D0FF097
MKKKIYLAIIVIILLFASYFYWQNRYVELRPVLVNENLQEPVLFSETFHNQLLKLQKQMKFRQIFIKT